MNETVLAVIALHIQSPDVLFRFRLYRASTSNVFKNHDKGAVVWLLVDICLRHQKLNENIAETDLRINEQWSFRSAG